MDIGNILFFIEYFSMLEHPLKNTVAVHNYFFHGKILNKQCKKIEDFKNPEKSKKCRQSESSKSPKGWRNIKSLSAQNV